MLLYACFHIGHKEMQFRMGDAMGA